MIGLDWIECMSEMIENIYSGAWDCIDKTRNLGLISCTRNKTLKKLTLRYIGGVARRNI